MSLQVWLPFTGHLNNQGLSNATITNTSAVVDDSGKLGKCYSFGTGASYININKETVTNFTTECTVCFWLYIISWNTSYATFLQFGKSGDSWGSYIFGFLRNATSARCCFTISNGSSATNANCLSSALDTGKWYHVCLVYSPGKCSIYLNGALDVEYTPTIVPDFTKVTKITIGKSYVNYQTNCKMNDFRIYDHALSPKEISELAKGLVLHYKLDGNLNVMNNCYSYPTFNTSAAGGGWNHWGGSGHIGTYGQNTDKNYIFNKSNTYSHWISDGAEATKNYLVYQSPAFEGGYRSIQCIVKEENGLPITEDIFFPDWNARDGGAPIGKWTSVTALGNGFYLCKCEGVHQNGSNDLIGFNVKPGYKVYISEAYCENDKEMCSDIFQQQHLNNTVVDCSGYCNNGTSIGTFSSSKLTPRYQYSASFNGTDNIITVPFNTLVPDGINFTINLWFKKDDLGSKSYETLFGGPSGFEMDTRAGSASTLSLYMASTRGGNVFSPFNFGEWYMVTMVNNGTNELYYVNGELKKTIEKKAMPTGTYRIGAWNSNTGQNYKGLMSDFRIYRTALTADQILQLYNAPISLANNGTLFAGEFIET